MTYLGKASNWMYVTQRWQLVQRLRNSIARCREPTTIHRADTVNSYSVSINVNNVADTAGVVWSSVARFLVV